MDREKVLALWTDLLDKWREERETVIYEYSGRIDAALAEMRQEAERLDAEFKKALGE